MLNSFRPILKKILRPIAKRISINPNIITFISPIIAILSAISFGRGYLLLGGLLILFSGFLDVVDGEVARYHNKTSDFGAFLDSTMDRFSDAIIIIGLIYGNYLSWFIGILAIHSAITVSYVRSSAESKKIPCNVGIADRAMRLIILVIATVIGTIFNESYVEWVVVILVILSYITVFQRMYHVWNYLKIKKLNR
jgi:archaetidylinositol phosphate synthase